MRFFQTVEYLTKNRCDALLVTVASWVEGLRKLGFEIPAQLSIASSLLTAADQQAGIAGMADNTMRICEQAIRKMDQKIRHGEVGLASLPVETVVPAVWFPGTTI